VTQGTVEYWQQLVSHVVLNRELGIEFDSLAPRGVVLRLRYSPAIAESDDAPRAHTGAIAAMVDACLGFSVHWALPDDRSLATLICPRRANAGTCTAARRVIASSSTSALRAGRSITTTPSSRSRWPSRP
jgi:acyl-coenzyme A thioesterase PaaI-like protein